MSARFYDVFQTTRGWVALLASERGIRRSTLPSATPDDAFNQLGQLERELEGAERDPARLGEIGERLVAYFDGEMVEFRDVELDVSDATDFSRRAWSACRSIPRGETRTYGWLARWGGQSERAARRRPDDGEKSGSDNRAVPPGSGQRRQLARLRQRRQADRSEATAARDGGRRR